MLDVLTRAGCFIAIIILGILLRRFGFFGKDAFDTLSKVTIKITLPASIVVSFASMDIAPELLTISILGLGGGILYIAVACLVNLRKSRRQRAFDVLNLPGYNIGVFTLPFVQSFLGPVGVVATSLFDTGNAFICLGGSYGVAASIKDGKGFDMKRIAKALLTSAPFVCYIIMILVNLLDLTVPAPVLSLAEIIKNANAFVAMLMIGVGFQLKANREQLSHVAKIIALRYGIAALVALCFYHLLPYSLEIRQALVILAFSPIGAAVPAFTGELNEDVGLSSAINSICIVISIVIIVTLLSFMLY